APSIVHGNALAIDWRSIVGPADLSYIVGNPPFVGAMMMSDANREDMARVFSGVKGYGVLDYVAAWYVLAVRFMSDEQASNVKCAFVSTNSISQGEQVGLLWRSLLSQGARIHFAHRTFKWQNEARGVAAV